MDRKTIRAVMIVVTILIAMILPCAAANAPFPTVTDSGVSRMDVGTHALQEQKTSWKSSEGSQLLAAWMQIPQGSDIKWDKSGCTNSAQTGCTGSVEYFAQWRFFTPDGKEWLKDASPKYATDYWRGVYSSDQGEIYLAHPKFFRAADGTENAQSGDTIGGPYYLVSDLISSNYQWRGQWRAELYIHDAIVSPRTSTRVATVYFTLVDDSGQGTTTTTAQVITSSTTSPYGRATTTSAPGPSASGTYTVIDAGTSTYEVSGPLLNPKSTWKASDRGNEANIAAWIQISPKTSMGDGYRPQFTYRLFTPDGKDWFGDIHPSNDIVSVDGRMVHVDQVKDFWSADVYSNSNLEYGEARIDIPWIEPRNNPGKTYQYTGPWTVDMIRVDYDGHTKSYTKVKTLTFNVVDDSTVGVTTTTVTPTETGYTSGTGIHIKAGEFTSAAVKKTGAEWDSTYEKCPTWRSNDWSGTGDYYLSHVGDTLTYSFKAPQQGSYVLWMRDWSDTNHASGDRQVTLSIDGNPVGTFDAANAFNRGTTGYGWDKLTTVSLSAGTHTLRIIKLATTSSAAIIDDVYLTPDTTQVPQGPADHSETLCSSGTTNPVTSTSQIVITPVITPVVVSACSGTGTSVYAEDRTLETGSTVKIPIMICNAQDLANMDLVVNYDTSVLKFRSADKGGLNANSLFESNEASSGTVMISFASSTGNTGSGSIAILTFDVIGSTGSTSPIKITVKTASTSSGSIIPVSVSQGTFTTGTPTKVSFDGGPVTSRDALAALQMAVGKIPVDTKYDVTKDGSVNSADARAILKIAVSAQ